MAQTPDELITSGGGDGDFKDRRARLSAKGTEVARNIIYGENTPDNILKPLWETGGLLWPYTPIITDNISVQYDSYDPIHANQPFLAFKSVAAKEIMCSGQFTAMNQQEAVYCLAAIHFLRTITKMYFGIGGTDSDAIKRRGTPPPVLLFNAHGTAMFHNVPVVVTSYSIELPQDVDYVELERSVAPALAREALAKNSGIILQEPSQVVSRRTKGITAWIPTKFNITVNMTVQNTPNRLRRNFNLNDFRTGNLIKKGGWI
jgi:hypothetical protein